MTDDDFVRVEGNDCPMSSCAAPTGSPCRTGRGKVAVQYHTARFRLVPSLAKALSVPVPPVRKPSSSWVELPRPVSASVEAAGHVRIGYARASTVRQSLDSQLDSQKQAGVTRVFSEKISTRAVRRPQLTREVHGPLKLRPAHGPGGDFLGEHSGNPGLLLRVELAVQRLPDGRRAGVPDPYVPRRLDGGRDRAR